MAQDRDPTSLLAAALHQRRLLLAWADVPLSPEERPPRNPALAIGCWQEQAPTLPPPPPALTQLPPLPILSLDPTDRVEAAFDRAGVPLNVVRTQRHVPTRDRHSLLKLGGHLATRAGLFLSWDDVRSAPSDPDKAHLLQEARRLVPGGAVVVLAPSPTPTFARLWRELVAPALRGAVQHFALGPAGFAWPAPLVRLEAEPGELLAALSEVDLVPLQVQTPTGALSLVLELDVTLTPDGVKPPVRPRLQHLPFNELSWEQFEALCAALIEANPLTVDCHLHGVPGDEQLGIDIVATQQGVGGTEVWAYQCKRYQDYTPGNLTKALGKMAYQADYYVLMLSVPAKAALRQIVVDRPDVFLWDGLDIARKLKDYPVIVEDFFGEAWRRAFCG